MGPPKIETMQLLLSVLLALVASESVHLTAANFDTEVFGGKSAFIKFQAPWWGHCKKMKPDWDALGTEYKDSKTVLIGDVDCTVEKDLCGKYGVRGYPTLKYFTAATAATGDAYEGGRSLADFQSFVKENLGPQCSPSSRDLCSEEQLAAITEVEAMPAADIEAAITEMTGEIEAANTAFEEGVAELNRIYQELTANKDGAAAKNGKKLGLYRSILASKAGARDEL